MKNIYSIEIKICATAYIVAGSEAEAQQLADTLADEAIEFSDRHQNVGENICVDGRSYDAMADNDEPIALSPVMTVHGAWSDDSEVELVEVLEGDEDEE
jgi:hypothetical protein